MDQYDLEQYKSALIWFDSEISRFWTRFNIMLGFQLFIMAGLIPSLERLHPESICLVRIVLIFLIFLSFMSSLSICRGIRMLGSFLQVILFIEKKSEKRLYILTTIKNNSKSSLKFNPIIGWIISVSMIVFWAVLLFHLESTGYSVFKNGNTP